MRLRSVAAAATAAAAAVGISAAVLPAASATAAGTPAVDNEPQKVLWVGNNWEGTATAVRADGSDLGAIGKLNIIPDKSARMAEITFVPFRLPVFLGIRTMVGQGHDQYVDDMYSTKDGKNLVVSRPSFGDVVSINIATGAINWRYEVLGWRADHMAVSEDRSRVSVSGSLSNKVFVLDMETGKELGRYATGDKPHESYFTKDGKQIWTESIGNVTSSLDEPSQDWTKGKRTLTIADANTFKVLKTIDMRPLLDAYGRKDVSNAMRPMTVSADEKKIYFQTSFHHGYSVYDVEQNKITEVVDLPTTSETPARRQDYLLDSAQHGISLTPDNKHLCVAGTSSNYATVVDPATHEHGPLVHGVKPYWITTSGDGQHCVVSFSGEDAIASLDAKTGELVKKTPVGTHPQRVRLGLAPAGWHGIG